ncbi:hypothetical protein L3Y34_009646 [Caenorhabditis briggsae]|uniref:Uncharacterized protein n=1 Tax=Caenorhabditis briggsae TaxID=6238 RepID=A0AAE9D1T2_CAEBR|nr:hypothetical protein L3Y34_009646 [Caenorhabditis briggsae]
MCAVGPKNNPSESDFKYGPPGSACPHGKTDSGLCKSRVQREKSEVKEEDNGSNHSSLLIALLVTVFFM